MRRVLIEVEARGAERQIEIENEHVLAEMLADGPRDIVRDRRAARAALGGNERNRAPDRRRAFGGKQVGDGVDDRLRTRGQNEIFRHARADQLAIEQHVVDMSEHDQPRCRVAHLGEPIQATRNLVGRQ
jgi:hypothetical protein